MTRLNFLFLLLTCLLTRPLPAQTQRKPASSTALAMATVESIVIDRASRQPITGASVSVKTEAGKEQTQQRTGADGAFAFEIDPKQRYSLRITASGYEPHEAILYFTSSSVNKLTLRAIGLYRSGTKPASAVTNEPVVSSATGTLPVPAQPATTPAVTTVSASPPGITATTPASFTPGSQLAPPKTLDAKVIYTPPPLVATVGKITKLEAIQFVQSKAELLPDAQPAMQQLLTYMQTHPTAEILLAGHTDNQGDFDANVKLSQERVDVVKAYLVSNGVAANRITARGYGPTRPVANNNREISRQQNRRVEMTVLKP